MIDDFNSECLAAIPDFSLSGLRVIRELEAIIAIRGKPAMIDDVKNLRRFGRWLPLWLSWRCETTDESR